MDEKQKKRKSMLITVGVQVVMLVLLYFFIAWKEPFPPIPEYGIELSLGFEQIDSETDAVPNEITSEDAPEQAPPDQLEQEQPEVSEQPLVEEQEENTEDQMAPAEEPSTTQDILSPDKQPVEVKDKVIPEATGESEKQVQEEVEKNTSPPKEEVKDPADKTAGEPTEEPKIDERALYSETASGEGDNRGATLQMTGWRLTTVPDPNDNSQETGQIVFEIKVDSDGYVVNTRTITSTVTPAVERLYRNAVQQLVLEKTADYKPAPVSTGRITFILKAH